MEQHPGAGIIITHRNPLEVVGSYSSMMMAVLPEQTQTDPEEMGQRVLEDLAGQAAQSMAARERLDPGRIMDVHYTDFTSDTMTVVDEIYSHLGLPYSVETRALIATYVKAHPRGKHGSHDYQLDQFGLNEQQVLDRFETYIQRYDIKV